MRMKHTLLFNTANIKFKLNEQLSEDYIPDIEADLISELKPSRSDVSESLASMEGSGWMLSYNDDSQVLTMTESIEGTVRDILDEYGINYEVV